jgi:hypothetical protein
MEKKICYPIFLCGSGSGFALDPDSKILWIRIQIRIEENCWIQIRIRIWIESIRIHNPGKNTDISKISAFLGEILKN